jgi:signal transduction histidine kinase/CheY-like chemotaxis protein
MRMRSQILLFLFLFGFAPLVVALAITIPLTFDRLEYLYRQSYLQNLRADFNDLDQYLASRREMVRLLVKLPEPGTLPEAAKLPAGTSLEAARVQYTKWTNLLLSDQPDIIQVLFLDAEVRPRLWLRRDPQTHVLLPGSELPDMPNPKFTEAVARLGPGAVLTSPIAIKSPLPDRDDGTEMTLRLGSPILALPASGGAPAQQTISGIVVINIDVGGLAKAYRNTYWVRNDGSYLTPAGTGSAPTTAFEDFPGLEDIFAESKLALWEGADHRQVIWVPLFATEGFGPLWVGRGVDPSPIASFLRALEFRIAVIVLILLLAILLLARWFALRAERIGRELTEGIGRMLERGEPVHFSWRGPQELRVLATNLNRLAQRYAENIEAMRAHAQELEETNRYKSEFLANVSHELRTPLNSILLLSKLLSEEDSDLPPDQARQARVIHQAANDLMGLIDNILDLSRIEAGKHSFHITRVDLPALLEELYALFQPQFDAKGLSLHLEIEDGAPREIETDGDKVARIIKNFLSNAVKFTHQGDVVVSLSGHRSAHHKARPVRVSVRDTGIGIPRDKQGFVFEAFEQADGSTRRRYGGTGLGLTISRELARLLGGAIELQSEEGRGSTFSLLLPMESALQRLDTTPMRPQTEPPSVAKPAETPTPGLAGRAILIIDPDLRHLLELTPALERWGIRVTAAGEVNEALETLAENDIFDLVMLDIMPDAMDCQRIIRAIRERPERRQIPIVVTGAGLSETQIRSCLEAGADAFVDNPMSLEGLKETLLRQLDTP